MQQQGNILSLLFDLVQSVTHDKPLESNCNECHLLCFLMYNLPYICTFTCVCRSVCECVQV